MESHGFISLPYPNFEPDNIKVRVREDSGWPLVLELDKTTVYLTPAIAEKIIEELRSTLEHDATALTGSEVIEAVWPRD